jgi:hypothetical protein
MLLPPAPSGKTASSAIRGDYYDASAFSIGADPFNQYILIFLYLHLLYYRLVN